MKGAVTAITFSLLIGGVRAACLLDQEINDFF